VSGALQRLVRRLGVRRARPTALENVRWVVIDCETSGLDPKRERLLSVGAVAVHGRSIHLEESFAAVLKQEKSSAPENILIHQIGADAQLAGEPASEALAQLAGFLAAGIPVAFNALFDETVLRRAMSTSGLSLPGRWLDLAQLAPALFPRRAASRRTLDDWLEEFRIEPYARHDALGDAFTSAQLLLVLEAEAQRQGITTLEGMLSKAG
jgi:DNA polymerase III subunit epsilon